MPPIELTSDQFASKCLVLPCGAQIYVRQYGDASAPPGQTLVLLHGISSGAASWLYLVHALIALAPKMRIIAWDAPGYGRSTRLPMQAPTAVDYAAQLHALLGQLGVTQCSLLGHSLGALMAAAYAHQFGENRLLQLLLISPAGGYGSAEKTNLSRQVRQQRLHNLHTLGMAGMAAQAPQRLLSPNAPVWAHDWVEKNALQLNPAGYLQAVELLCQDDLERYVPLSMPVHIYCGALDAITPPQSCADWAKRFAASFTVIAEAGHASPIEQAYCIATHITPLLHHGQRQHQARI